MPLNEIIAKLKESSDLTEDEINNKIKQKMDQLSGLISKEGAAHIIANELGVQLIPIGGSLQIKNILPGMRSVETNGKVTRIFDIREFGSDEKKGKVGSFFMGDETGQIRVTCWHDKTNDMKDLKEGDIVKVVDAYVRENNGFKELHLNDRSRIVLNPSNVNVGEVKKREDNFKRKTINTLQENENFVELFGTIVQVYDIKFFERCPECKKRIRDMGLGFSCEKHGKTNPEYAYVMNVFLDDSTGNIRSVFFSNQIQNLTKKTNEELLIYKDMPEKFDEVKTELLGEQIIVKGRVTKNTMFDRLEFMTNIVERDVDLEKEINRLKEDIEKNPVKQETPATEVKAETKKEETTPQPTTEEVKIEEIKTEQPTQPTQTETTQTTESQQESTPSTTETTPTTQQPETTESKPTSTDDLPKLDEL